MVKPDSVSHKQNPPNSNPIPQTLKDRTVKSEGEVEVKSSEITIKVWDDNFVDQDIISLWLNENNILDNYELTGKPREIKIKLDPNTNYYLMLYAIDQGKMPPCTVAVSIIDNGIEKRLKLSSDLKNCGALKISQAK